MVSQKCQYAVRATFELARRYGQGPVKISEIAEAQAIPPRFLEVILNQLRQGGFVQSRRGVEGGYYLIRQAGELTIGEIIQFIEGPTVPVACMVEKGTAKCSLYGNCVFIPMWKRVAKAASDIYDHTSFQDLVNDATAMNEASPLSYSI
jgi:Rrf2 family transcriptional regulator, cysteine metabolism repressor